MDREESSKWLNAITAIVDHYRGGKVLSETELLETIQVANTYRGFQSELSNFEAVALFQRIQEERNLYLKKFD